jgi:hypothetical protein
MAMKFYGRRIIKVVDNDPITGSSMAMKYDGRRIIKVVDNDPII